MTRKRVAILISGRGSNMRALIAASAAPSFPAQIPVVISNVPDAAGLAHARTAGVATEVIDHRPFGRDRAAFESALTVELARHKVEIICLAGFMRLFTPNFVNAWSGRMLNIHPSLLPSFPGLDPHGQALRAGVKLSGATVHFVTPETDAGPIVAQIAVPVVDDDTAETLGARVLRAEHRLYPRALSLVASGKAEIVDGRCRVTGAIDADAQLLSLAEDGP